MVGIGFAGGGVYALVSYPIASEGVMLVTAWLTCSSRPQANADWTGLASLLRTGFSLTGYNLLLYPLQQLDTLLTGRWFGAQALGFYNRAGQLLVQPTTHLAAPFADVLLSTLARLGPHSPAYAPHLRTTANAIAHLTLPFVALCVALPEGVVRLALGTSWGESAELLRWLAISAAPSFVTATIYPLCVTTGHATRLMGMTAVTLITTSSLLFLGRDHGALGVARALAAGNLLLVLPRLWWSTRGTPVSLADYWQALHRPIVAAAIIGAGMAVSRNLCAESPWLVQFLVGTTGGGLALALSAITLPGLRTELRALGKNLPFHRESP
jgi:PST family polysaccharide transporter